MICPSEPPDKFSLLAAKCGALWTITTTPPRPACPDEPAPPQTLQRDLFPIFDEESWPGKVGP